VGGGRVATRREGGRESGRERKFVRERERERRRERGRERGRERPTGNVAWLQIKYNGIMVFYF